MKWKCPASSSLLVMHVHDTRDAFSVQCPPKWYQRFLHMVDNQGMLQEAQMYLTCQAWREWILILDEPLCIYSSSFTSIHKPTMKIIVYTDKTLFSPSTVVQTTLLCQLLLYPLILWYIIFWNISTYDIELIKIGSS